MNSRRRFLRTSAASAAGVFCGSSLFAWSDSSSAARDAWAAGEHFLNGDGARGSESLFGSVSYSSRPGRVKIWRFGQNNGLEINLPFLHVDRINGPHPYVRVVEISR